VIRVHSVDDGDIVFSAAMGVYYWMTVGILVPIGIVFTVWAFLGSVILLIVGITFLIFAAWFASACRSVRYTLEKDGIRLKHSTLLIGVRLQKFIPYSEIARFYETNRLMAPAFSPVTSSDMVMIVFENINGRRGDMVALSPKNKRMFISELSLRTGIRLSADPHAKK